MSLKDLVIHSQLQPPRPGRNLLHRPRLDALLADVFQHPLTILHAGTGYGKSTALASLVVLERQLFWYTIAETDHDPLLFLVHLLSSFGEYGEAAMHSLESNNVPVTPGVLIPLLNELAKRLKNDAVLVIDDFHFVSLVDEIIELFTKLVDFCPANLHIVVSTRQMPEFLAINRWRVKGVLNILSDSDLAFTADEIKTLFHEQYRYPISDGQAKDLASVTEGWVIAIQMIWQSLQSGMVPDLETALKKLPLTFDRLFDYLAPEVLARQPAEIQAFLQTTCILRQLDGAACDALLERSDSADTLRHLHEIGLFIERVGEATYRYQRLFQDFLLNEIGKKPAELVALHQRAAQYFQETGHPEERLYHLIEAGEFLQAADSIEKIGAGLLASGRIDSLSDWLERFPAELRAERPFLAFIHGDVCRQRAEFEEALKHYRAAAALYQVAKDPLGQSRALRGQAQLYLDTVRPLQAAALLADAIDLLDPDAYPTETADLLEQLAENKLNSGFPDQALALHEESLHLRAEAQPTDIYLNARILLRTGKLSEAERLLESYYLDETDTGLGRQQHFHREKQLLLSLLSSLKGNQGASEQYARQGIEIGQKMQSEYVEAVAYMRLGHALQLENVAPWTDTMREAAIRCYQQAIEKARPFKVARVNLEPLWGLCRAYGYAGDVEQAEKNALQAIEISRTAGDEWIGHLVRITFGAVLAMDGRANTASRWLKEAAEGLNRVQDTFGWSAAQMWLALNAWWKGEEEVALRHLSALLPVVSENGYDFLLIKRTHLGLKDDQAVIPLLLEGHRQNIEREYIINLLTQARNRGVETHPGYTLWVRTLGAFAVWRGDALVPAGEWQREKARQMFQLFITARGQWLQREKITDLLWPDLPEESAARDFKVALNAMHRVLEPRRERNSPTCFIVRQGTAYGINPQAPLVTDADHFLSLAASEETEKLALALKLYEDDFLPDCIYFDWASLNRESYRQKYLAVSQSLCEQYLKAQRYEDVLEVCQAILRREKSWEPAYLLMMKALASQGNIAQAVAVYQRCTRMLQDELGLDVSDNIKNYHQLLTKGY